MVKNEQPRLEVNDMRMLRCTCGVTTKDQIRNKHVRVSVNVEPVTKNITEKRLKWYGHVKRRDEGHVLRSKLHAPPVPVKIRKGRQKHSGGLGHRPFKSGQAFFQNDDKNDKTHRAQNVYLSRPT